MVIASPLVTDDRILDKIYVIRGQKVMLDRDLAKLYDVSTKVLKQALKRNLRRFPGDFAFEMTREELEKWRSQFVTSNADKMGLRHSPFCFTELGVAMLSSVLKSDRAIAVNIQIMRVFTRLRQMLFDNTELRLAIEEIRKKTENNSKNIELVFQYLDELLEQKEQAAPTVQIGYKSYNR